MPTFVPKPHLILLTVVLATHISLTLYTSWRLPLSAGPDEVAHFQYARFLKHARALPLTPEDRDHAGYKSDQPPLNALMVALAAWPSDLNGPPDVKLAHGIPRRHLANDGWVDQYGVTRYWQVVNTADPLAGEILLWRIGRLLSTIFSSLTLIVIYFIAKQLFAELPQSHLWAVSAVSSVAFIPTFIFISSVLSYEALLGLWLSLYLLIAMLIFRGRQTSWLYLLAGLFAGLALITKLSALPIPVSLVILIVLAGVSQQWAGKDYLTRLTLAFVGLLMGAGWWFGWIIYHLNRVAELGWLAGLLAPIISGDGSDKTSAIIVSELSATGLNHINLVSGTEFRGWLTTLFNTFWTPYPQDQQIALTLCFGLSILMVLGLGGVYWRHQSRRLWLIFLVLHGGLFFILPAIRLILLHSKTVAGQGHHILLPTIGVVATLMVWGLGTWVPATKGWLAGMIVGGGLLVWTIIHIGQIYPVVNPVPVRTTPPILPATAHEFEIDFDQFQLTGYELIGLTEQGSCCLTGQLALQINLYWLAEEFSGVDYRIEVTLANETGDPQTSWFGYTANGRYPSRAWEPGDIIRDDIYLPLTGLKPGRYTVQLQLWSNQERLADVHGQTEFTLTEVTVATPQPMPTSSPIQVWQTGQPVDHRPDFENRATIQITTRPGVELPELINEIGELYEPVGVAGHTYHFIVDPLWRRGAYRLQLEDRQTEPILQIIGRNRQTDIPASQVEVKANFANQIMLLGYDLPETELAAGDLLPVTLNWQALQTMPTDFLMFVRIRDGTGQVWGGRDRWPQEFYSTLLWAKGEVVADGFTVQISSQAPAGIYYLDVGFYFVAGQAPVSLPLVQDGQLSEITHVTLGPFTVQEF